MSVFVKGEVDPAFRAVREVFESSFADGRNTGAAVAVIVDGRTVVDLWGGVADTRANTATTR
ncbi:serine hydrolase [Nocardia sp. NPDC046763]|uniref:serine hydrolase n=1 Tax=Nocardia sp. NPDC046763 TaxID=3155256 RepID=UPI0033EEEDF7